MYHCSDVSTSVNCAHNLNRVDDMTTSID